MSMYSRIAARPDGKRELAAARLRYETLVLLQEAFEASGLASEAELAKKLRVRRTAVHQVLRGDGNVALRRWPESVITKSPLVTVFQRPSGGCPPITAGHSAMAMFHATVAACRTVTVRLRLPVS